MTLSVANQVPFGNFDEMKNKEALIKLKNQEIIDGVIRGLEDENLIVSKNGEWRDKINVSIVDIENMNLSKYPYFTMEHKRDLRERKIPRYEFRYDNETLKKMIGCYVFINYDGKLIDGEITSVNLLRKSMTISNGNDEKEIMCYQLIDLEFTGKSESEHNGKLKLREIESKIYEELERINKGDKNALCNKTMNPDDLLDDYFEFKMGKCEAKNFEYSWLLEIMESHSSLNNSNKKIINERVMNAKKVNEYYQSRICLIDFIIKEVNKVDWTQYSMTQSLGVNTALNYFYDSEIIRTN